MSWAIKCRYRSSCLLCPIVSFWLFLGLFNDISSFYILLTVHHVMILGKWPTWRTILFCVFIYIFNFLHVSSTSCSSSGETNCVNITSGSCHSVSMAVSCVGRKFTFDLHTTRHDTPSYAWVITTLTKYCWKWKRSLAHAASSTACCIVTF